MVQPPAGDSAITSPEASSSSGARSAEPRRQALDATYETILGVPAVVVDAIFDILRAAAQCRMVQQEDRRLALRVEVHRGQSSSSMRNWPLGTSMTCGASSTFN
jgi:hypothetical protein